MKKTVFSLLVIISTSVLGGENEGKSVSTNSTSSHAPSVTMSSLSSALAHSSIGAQNGGVDHGLTMYIDTNHGRADNSQHHKKKQKDGALQDGEVDPNKSLKNLAEKLAPKSAQDFAFRLSFLNDLEDLAKKTTLLKAQQESQSKEKKEDEDDQNKK